MRSTSFTGRILVTDNTSKENRNRVITNLVNHKSSRAAVYVLLQDFQDVSTLLEMFPTAIPVVIQPLKNLDETRKLFNLLPHMDHYVNFLGDQLAQEFLGRRESFRIKDVPLNYVLDADKVIDKVMESSEKGIIFNVATSADTRGSYLETAVMDTIDKSKNTVKNLFRTKSKLGRGQVGTQSEKTRLLDSQSDEEDESGPSGRKPSTIVRDVNTESQEREGNQGKNFFLDFLLSILCFCCPFFKRNKQRGNVPLHVDQYPTDLDDRMESTLQELHRKAAERWSKKVFWVEEKRDEALAELNDKIDNWKQKTSDEMKEKNEERDKTTSSSEIPDYLKKGIAASNRRRESKSINQQAANLKRQELQEMDEKFALVNFWEEHYNYVVEKQLKNLLSVWNRINGNGCFS